MESSIKQTSSTSSAPDQPPPSPLLSDEECSICLDFLPKFASDFARLSCCGQGLHLHCSAQLSNSNAGENCPLCRGYIHELGSHGELIEITTWANNGKPWAQNLLAQMYKDGSSVAQNWKTAIHWYTVSANQGYPESQQALAIRYREGQGVTQSYAKALYWNEQAAAQGLPDGLANLGQLYANG